MKELFANAILEEQATLVDHSQKGTYTAIAPLTERPNYVLSSSQRRLWVLSQFEESNTAYNMPGVYVIKGRLQPALLGAAFNAVIVRHEILRTVFNSDEEGEVRQYVQLASEDFKVLFKDVRGQVASLPAIIDNFCNAGFELATGPLMRVGVFEVSDQEWVLAFVMHHIISDGWSLGVLIRELLQVYNQPATAGDLPPLAIQYKDYAVWQQEQLSSGILAQQRAYWLSQLAGELPVLALAGDRPRPAVKTYKGAQVHRQLDADLSLQLALLVQAANSTLFMGITAAVNALLYRYTKQEDIIVGTPVAGREHSDLENQIGFYVNTLTLRTRLSGDNSYRELLDIIRDVTLQAYEHQAYPFDELVDDLQLQRDMSRNPLFDVMVQLQDGELTPKLNNTSINGITIQGYNGKRTTISKFDLSFIFEPTNVGMNMVVDYCTDIFNAATIERLASHFVQLLAAMLESPTMPVKKINYLTKQEEQVLLRQFNDTRVDYPADKTLPALFAEQVIIQPQRIALVFGATAYSYKELDELSNRFANFLQEQHQVQPGDLIGIKQERSEWLIITILGILKAGGAYVPIDPVYPEDRIAFMLSDTNCRVMITADELTQFQATIGCYSTFSPVCMQTPDSLAYIMYTSGSTGTPKGVMVSHRNIVRLVRSCGYVALTGQEALLSTGAVSFDATTFEYWGMLLNGGKLVLCSQDSLLDEQLMTQVIAGNKVDIMWFTAGWLHQLIDKDINIFAGLKTIIAGGDKLSALHINRLRRHYPGMQVINGYGPTENTTFSLTYNIQSSMSDIPLGYPINNSTVYIMDELLQLCPVGVTGEIIVGGDGLALGYLNRTELTAEKFIDHPYVSGERVYRTGDLGRWLPDGSIAFIGRRDDQVKIRGYRIEPGEIEHVLQAYPGISSALLVVFSTASGEKELAAYFTGEPGLDAIEIRAYLGKHLPAYMLPDYYVQLDSFPLTPNGKVDKKKLPSPQSGGRASDREYVAPRNATEEQLLVIWKEILGRSDISVKDNFFEMGGHSLRATRLASQLYKVFEVKIPLKELFGAPVLEDQAVLITSARKTTYSSILPAILQSSYPLSSSQRRLWLLSQLENGNVAYNIPGVYVFIGELHLASLNFAFNELIQRHEILRTVFRENEKGELRQYIVPAAQQLFSIQYTDLRTAKDQDQRVEALVKAGATQPFNLAEGPLLRAGLYQVGDSRWVFAYTVHHIISDGWSMEILIRELLLIYNHHVQGIPHSLLPLAIQYKDYACWQQAQLEDGILAADQVYWLLQLEGELPVLELPTDHVRSAVRTYKSGVVTHQFPEHAVEQLRTLCQQQGATMFMGLQGLVNVLLHRYTQQEDIITGTPVAGRGHADLLDQIGFYVNTLALRIRFSGGDSYTTLLDHVREVTLAAFEHQAYPFDELVDQLDLQRDVSRNVLFDVMVMLQHDQSSLRHIPSMHGLDIQGYESNSLEVSKFDITFAFIESGASLTVNIKYNTDLFDPSTIERMATHLEQLLHTVTSRPDSPINMLPYLTEAEEDRLLNTFSSSHVSFDRRATVVSMFEAQIRKMPDQIALVHEGQTLTYAALNKRANQLAHYLQEHHQAGAGMLTGILADRSIDMMVAILGILKAGSAYVPIDPEFPEARIQYLLQDSGVQVIVTQSRYRTMVDTFNVAAVYLDDSAAVMEMPDEDPVMAAMPADLAYVIYTSGSTGQPKGVMITHGALADYAYGILARTNIAECRTFGLVSTIAADLGNTVIYTSLLIGGTLYIYSTQTLMSGEELFATPVDCIKIVPSHWKALQPAGGPLFAPQKCLVFGGEQLTGDVLTLLYNNHAGCQVYNHYGPSETTIGKLINRVSLTENDGVIPLGTPFCNSFFCIIDPQFQLTGIGITGEICIGGDGLSPGYLHREALTAERFVANPFCPGERMYRTGDLGRWLPDGNIVFMGRSDDQVKIRGYRIELGEIASVMQSHEDIDAAVVIARSNAVGEKELVSYFTGNSAVSKTSLRTFLAQRLPSYSLPAHYVQLESLPLTANGKIDRRQLPVPEGLGLTGTTQYITAGTPTEKLLTSIWEELLHRTSIGIDDNFFEMGGHSLMAVKLVNRINRELSASIKVADVFHHTSIRELAQLIDSCPQQADESVIPVAPLAAGYVLSTNQRRLWLTCQQADNTVAYNIPGALLLEGPLNTALLKDAYLLLTARHESLRTVLVNDEVLPEQKILPAGYPDFEIQEVAYMPAREEIDQLVRIESSIPFPMDDQLLVRVKILVFPDNRYLLMVVMHHIISDGWSMEIFIKEWIALYAGLQQGKLPALPPMVIQYKDYAVWQQHYISSPAFQKEISYWQQRLAGELPVLNLPFAQARSAAMGIDGDVFSFMVDDSLYTGLQQLALNRQCTLYSLMFTAFNVLLYHISHQQEVILGTSVAGRRHESLESIIGFFVNTLAIKTSINTGETFVQLLQRTSTQLLRDFEHQDMPFEELVTHLDYERIPGVNPVFQARFVLNSERENDLAGLEELNIKASPIGIREVNAKFDLSLIIRPGRNLSGMIEYRSQLFRKEIITLIAEGYLQLLAAVIADPEVAVAQLDTFNSGYKHYLSTSKKAVKDNLLKKLQSLQKK
ncbi:non-ribosomal peptide synthetase [[Flexibacter] sp. ATCC 35208]|uniref:non-ribosomal peptide synthetase n=1 Tax=[Flexibacter] sp. ATCC 35208 TaxID=1936242 RepID=UPI001C6FCD3F|nr:non-ribosomal peptide synthetase [[Flexibacter] sp. ATCC 35208]